MIQVDGEFEEINEFSDLHGMNATFGALWTVNRHLGLGCSVDLPWKAEAEQKKTVRNTVTTYSSDRSRVLDESFSEQVETKDVKFEFPLYWAVGAVWRWTPLFYMSLDVSQTLWSDFAFRAEGEEKINPLDGTRHGKHKIDDTWSVRGGAEYLVVLRQTEIPLRGGVAWEQRPAVGSPDEFWIVSLGSGVSVGRGEKKLIFDLAYALTLGDDVLGSLVPGRSITSDVVEHQVFLSCIRHF